VLPPPSASVSASPWPWIRATPHHVLHTAHPHCLDARRGSRSPGARGGEPHAACPYPTQLACDVTPNLMRGDPTNRTSCSALRLGLRESSTQLLSGNSTLHRRGETIRPLKSS
jgi:hypothetical protein